MSARRIRLSLETAGGLEEVLVTRSPDGSWLVDRDGTRAAFDLAVLPDGRVSLLLQDGRQLCGRIEKDPGHPGVLVTSSAGAVRVAIEDALAHRLAASVQADAGGGEEIHALMPGRVLEVTAREGDEVSPGAVLLIVEAMKMQNEIRATREGRIIKVAVTAGQAVDKGTLLVEISGR